MARLSSSNVYEHYTKELLFVSLAGMCIKTCVRLSWRVTLRRTSTAGRLRSSELVFTQRKTRYTRVSSRLTWRMLLGPQLFYLLLNMAEG